MRWRAGPPRPFFSPRSPLWPRRRRKIRWLVLFLLAFLVVTSAFLFTVIERNLRPTILAIAEARSKQIAVEAINDVINEKIVPAAEYQELVKVHKDGQARVTLLQPNVTKMNKLQAEAAREVNNSLKNLGRNSFYIPLGQVLGSQLLASYGPRIKVNFVPYGTVKVERIDRFEEAGINQTRHMIFFRVTGSVRVVIPLETSEVKVTSEVLVADNIILGEVPRTYVNFKAGEGSRVDLPPVSLPLEEKEEK